MDPKKYFTKKMKKKLTDETFAIWELGFRAGYETCIEDAVDEKVDKVKKKKDENHDDIIKILTEFSVFNPTINFGNVTQRKAAKSLVKAYGIDNVMDMIKYAFKIQEMEYAPLVTTPYDLLNKVNKLEAFSKRNGIS